LLKTGVRGPWLVTADLADGDNLKIECKVNGETRQSSNTSDMVSGRLFVHRRLVERGSGSQAQAITTMC
jgi:Fumarylacetoacetate (FAA) hydrolase family